jgi:hypothetical protein
MLRDDFKSTMKHSKRSVAFFDTYSKSHGCIIGNVGESWTFWFDEKPTFMPSKYYLEYNNENGDRSGISLTDAFFWVVPVEESFLFVKVEKILEGIVVENWKKATYKEKQYFVIPYNWLEENGRMFKNERNP